jgi:hypothetical protein
MSEDVFTVSPAYQGITAVAHGGYVAGLFAPRSSGPTRVTLRRPPPLDTRLTVNETRLVDDAGKTIMEAGPGDELEGMPPVILEEARSRAPHARFADHPYPECFMCGTNRDDGFHLRVASPDQEGLAVGTWTPASPLLGDSAIVPPEFVWAVVDCLTVWSFADQWDDPGWWPAVTGQITVEELAPVHRGEAHVVVGRVRMKEGRKVMVDAVVSDADGRLCAKGRAVWVVIAMDRP